MIAASLQGKVIEGSPSLRVSEEDAEHEADAVLLRAGVVQVGEAPHVLDVQDLEDVVHAHAQL